MSHLLFSFGLSRLHSEEERAGGRHKDEREGLSSLAMTMCNLTRLRKLHTPTCHAFATRLPLKGIDIGDSPYLPLPIHLPRRSTSIHPLDTRRVVPRGRRNPGVRCRRSGYRIRIDYSSYGCSRRLSWRPWAIASPTQTRRGVVAISSALLSVCGGTVHVSFPVE